MKLFLSVCMCLLLSSTAQAMQFFCDTAKLKAQPMEIYVSGEVLIQVAGPEMADLVGKLGFKKIRVSRQMPINKNHCSAVSEEAETWGREGSSSLFTTQNPCEQNILKTLGYSPEVIENYGSMDSGYMRSAASLLICTNGTEWISCNNVNSEALKNSSACLEKLEKQ